MPEEVEAFVRAHYHLKLDLERAGYAVDDDTDGDDAIRAFVHAELYDSPKEKYDASPTRIDIMARPKHYLRASSSGGGLDDSPLEVDSQDEIPPRIYVHFACFPAHVFKVPQMTAALNNLREQRGVTSRDTVVFVTVKSVSTSKLDMCMHALATTNLEYQGREGQYIIQFLLPELQFDLQAHVLVPPTRVLHCKRKIREKLARVAHVLSPDKELIVFSTKEPHMRRLFARPGDVVEALVTSETDVARPMYGVVKMPEMQHIS